MESVQLNPCGRKHERESGEVSDNAPASSLPNGGASSDLDSISQHSHESGSGEQAEVSAFVLGQGMEPSARDANSKLMLPHDIQYPNLACVDPATQAKLQALLEAAGIGELTNVEGRLLSDIGSMPGYTASMGCALNEAAAALTRMRSDSVGVHGIAADRTLAEACSDGDVGAVRKLLSEGRSVNETTDEGESLLSLACCAGYFELAEVLLAMKANVEDRGIKGDLTPLMEAAGRGYTDIVRLLIAHGADINAQSNIGSTALHCAAGGGHEEIVKMLINAGAGVEDQNENGHTPLMEAASAGHVGVARLLLKCGAGINTHSSEFKESALTLACYKGHLDMAKFLLEAGADQEHKTDEMHTALMEASMDGHVEVARLLLDHGAQVNMPADSFESPLTLAACGGHVELANLLIERGANLEEVNDEGYTPLMEAAREGHEEMVALLLAHGAFINAQTEETQETALTLACCGGFVEVADFLIKAGADIELGCSTPLMEAAQEGHYDLVRHLISAGANIHAQTGNGDTALTYACENGHTDIAELLLLAGAELEHESEGGRTPLMKAARAGHQCTVQFLVTRGADVNRATTINDHTVLSLACAGGHTAVVEYLLGHHADPTHKLKDGSTMLIEAARGGHTQVVNMLLDFPNYKALDKQQPVGAVPLALESTDSLALSPGLGSLQLATIDDGSGLDQEMLTTRLEQFINKMMAQADGVDASSACSNADEQQLHQAKKQEILNELHRVELELRGRRTAMVAAAGTGSAVPATYDPALAEAPAVPNFMSLGLQTHAQWQQLIQQQQQQQQQLAQQQQQLAQQQQQQHNEQQLQQQKEFYHFKVQQQLRQQYHQKQLQMQQKQPPFDLARSAALQLLPPPAVGTSAAVANSSTSSPAAGLPTAVLLPPPPPSPASPDGASPQLPPVHHPQAVGCPAAVARRPVPLHIALQNHLEAHRVVDGSVTDLAQALQDWDNRDRNIIYPSEVKPMPAFFSQKVGDDGGAPAREETGGAGFTYLEASPPPPSAATPTAADMRQVIYQKLQDANNRAAMVAATAAAGTSGEESPASQQSLAQVLAALIHGQSDSSATGFADSAFTKAGAEYEEAGMWSAQLGEAGSFLQVKPGRLGSGPDSGGRAARCIDRADAGEPPSEGEEDADNEGEEDRHSNHEILSQLEHLDLGNRFTEVLTSMSMAVAQPQQDVCGVSVLAHGGLMEVPHKIVTASPVPPARSVATSLPHSVSVVDPNAATESNHDTALTLACAGGHAELVHLLLSRKAEIEHKDKKGFTPLILAATAGHVEVVEILLDQNADIEAQSERTKDTALSLACSGGRYEVVELLLRRGANKEHRNVSDYTPLSLAASGGYVNIIKLLLNHGAEINSRTGSKLGISPLMLAAMNGHTAAVKILLDMGSDINAQIETNRNTALTLACFQGRHEVVSLLVDRRANIEHRAKTGLTPLMEAASGGYVEVGRVLLDKGADVNAAPVPSSRDTALTIAADKGHYRFVELLLSHGALVDVKNKKGNSPLWLSSNGGHLDVVQLLVGAGADIDSQDNRRVTCLMAAFRKGHLKVVKWLVRHVTQFPSDNECARYISTATDKELLKKCQQCMDVIVAAKDRQAAEANKNATSLLEEIETEKTREEKRREAAARKREKKKLKRKEKQQQQQPPQQHLPLQSNQDKPNALADDDDDDDDDADLVVLHSSEGVADHSRCSRLGSPGPLCNGDGSIDYRRHTSANENKENTFRVQLQDKAESRVPPSSNALTIGNSTASEKVRSANCHDSDSGRKSDAVALAAYSTSGSSADRVPDGGSPLTQKKNKKNRRQSPSDEAPSRTAATSVVASSNDKKIPAFASINAATDSAPTSRLPRATEGGSNVSNNSSVSNRTSDIVVLSHASVAVQRVAATAPPAKAASAATVARKARPDSNAQNDDTSASSASSLKNSKQRRLGTDDVLNCHNDGFEKKQTSSVSPAKASNTGKTAVSPSPKKGKREEGWKEVVRKSKKVAVPVAAAGRVLGRSVLAAVREISGATVDVDAPAAGVGGDRSLTIKGSADAIRQANNLITTLIMHPERDGDDLLGKKKNRRPQQQHQQNLMASANGAAAGAISTASAAAPAGNTNVNAERTEELSVGAFGTSDGSASPAQFAVGAVASATAIDGSNRPKYSAAVLSGCVSAAAAVSQRAGQQQQLRPPLSRPHTAAATSAAAASAAVSVGARVSGPAAPAVPSHRSPAPVQSIQLVASQTASGPRLLARPANDVSRQLFPTDSTTKDHSMGVQPLAQLLPPGGTMAAISAATSLLQSAPNSFATASSLTSSASMPKTSSIGIPFGSIASGRAPGTMPPGVALGASAPGLAALPEGSAAGAAATFTPFEGGSKLTGKSGHSYAATSTIGQDKPPGTVEADPAKAPGFRPPSLGTPDLVKDSGCSKPGQSPRLAPGQHRAAVASLPAPAVPVPGSEDSAGEFPLSYHAVPPSFSYAPYARPAFPIAHFYEGMHSGLKSPSMISPRGTAAAGGSGLIMSAGVMPAAARDEYTTPDQPMTLPRISSSLNPNASEFRASHGGSSADVYVPGQLVTVSASPMSLHPQSSSAYSDAAYLASTPFPSASPLAAGVAAPGLAPSGGGGSVSGMLLQPMTMLMSAAPNYQSAAAARMRLPGQPLHAPALGSEMIGSGNVMVGLRQGTVSSGDGARSPSPPVSAATPVSGSSPQERGTAEDRMSTAQVSQSSLRPIGTERLQKKQQLLPHGAGPVYSAVNPAGAAFGTTVMAAMEKPPHLQGTAAAPAVAPANVWNFSAMLSQDWPNTVLGQHAALQAPSLMTVLPTPHGYADSLTADNAYKTVDGTSAGCYNAYPVAPIFSPAADLASRPGWNSAVPPRAMASSASGNRAVVPDSDWPWPPQQPTSPNS